METLLPCPFCGGHAEFDEKETPPDKFNYVAQFIHHVGCANDECIAHCLTDSFDRKTEAAKAWNERATLANPAGEVDVVEIDCDECGGKGTTYGQTCVVCGGSGIIQASRPTQDSERYKYSPKCNIHNTLLAGQLTELGAMRWFCPECIEHPIPPPESDRQRALESLEWLEILGGRHEEPSIVGAFKRVREYITAPQPHVGVEVTRAFALKVLQKGAGLSFNSETANICMKPDTFVLCLREALKITAQKKGDE